MFFFSSLFICLIIKPSFINSLENMSAIECHGVVPDVIDVVPANSINVTIFYLWINLNLLLESCDMFLLGFLWHWSRCWWREGTYSNTSSKCSIRNRVGSRRRSSIKKIRDRKKKKKIPKKFEIFSLNRFTDA